MAIIEGLGMTDAIEALANSKESSIQTARIKVVKFVQLKKSYLKNN